MNVCFRWLYLNTTDPDGQLAWLINTLQDAEDKKEKVSGALTPDKCTVFRSWWCIDS